MDSVGGWDQSAQAWIDSMGDTGDWSRTAVLDPVMLARTALMGPADALDVGCGEGRFCRFLARAGMKVCGIDRTAALIDAARRRHPEGDYRVARAEELPFAEASFDLVVSYLSLIDIDDHRAAIAEMSRVLRPSGKLLIANLTGLNTAGTWLKDERGERLGFLVDHYMEERPVRQQWKGIDIINWHRPLRSYLQPLLAEGLRLTFFDEPLPSAQDDPRAAKFARVPWFVVMEWQKD